MKRWLPVALLLALLIWGPWGGKEWVASRDVELEYAEAQLLSLQDVPAVRRGRQRHIVMMIAPSERTRWQVISYDWSVSHDLAVGQGYRWGIRSGDAAHEVLKIEASGGREIRSQADTRRNLIAQRSPTTWNERLLNLLVQLFIIATIVHILRGGVS